MLELHFTECGKCPYGDSLYKSLNADAETAMLMAGIDPAVKSEVLDTYAMNTQIIPAAIRWGMKVYVRREGESLKSARCLTKDFVYLERTA